MDGALLLGRHQDQQAGQRIAQLAHIAGPFGRLHGEQRRSEEHTSELQSLMRISYAVFCLKKKKNNNKHTKSQYNQNNKMKLVCQQQTTLYTDTTRTTSM